jgi:hypothetical protein
MRTITKEEVNLILDAALDGIEAYHRALERLTGITAKSYTAYQYFDEADNYIGDSGEDGTNDLLHKAYIKVVD